MTYLNLPYPFVKNNKTYITLTEPSIIAKNNSMLYKHCLSLLKQLLGVTAMSHSTTGFRASHWQKN